MCSEFEDRQTMLLLTSALILYGVVVCMRPYSPAASVWMLFSGYLAIIRVHTASQYVYPRKMCGNPARSYLQNLCVPANRKDHPVASLSSSQHGNDRAEALPASHRTRSTATGALPCTQQPSAATPTAPRCSWTAAGTWTRPTTGASPRCSWRRSTARRSSCGCCLMPVRARRSPLIS